MQFLQIFITGWLVLVGALLLNWLAAIIKVPTWYDYVKKTKPIKRFGYVWLFIIYPFGLGAIAYTGAKLFIS